MRRHTNRAVQPQKIDKVLISYMLNVQGIYYLSCEEIVADHLIAQLLCSCSELFWPMQSWFHDDVAQMRYVQIRNLRIPHSSPLCLLVDFRQDCSKEIP